MTRRAFFVLFLLSALLSCSTFKRGESVHKKNPKTLRESKLIAVRDCSDEPIDSGIVDLESDLFRLVCSSFLQTDSLIKTKVKLTNVFEVVDPVNDTHYVLYPQKPWSSDVQSFSKYDLNKQLTILRTDSIPIVPFRDADTIVIVDSLRFFAGHDLTLAEKHFMLQTNIENISKTRKLVFLHQVAVRANVFLLSFTFPNSDLLYTIHIANGTPPRFLKTSTLNLIELKQHMRN